MFTLSCFLSFPVDHAGLPGDHACFPVDHAGLPVDHAGLPVDHAVLPVDHHAVSFIFSDLLGNTTPQFSSFILQHNMFQPSGPDQMLKSASHILTSYILHFTSTRQN